MSIKSNEVLVPVFLIAFGFMSACSTAQTPPEPAIPIAVQAPAPSENGEALNAPEMREEPAGKKEEEVFINYNPKGRRDPFRSIVVTRTGVNAGKDIGSLPPLQRRDLSELKVIGIVWGEMGPSAIITVPDGKGYAVRVGTRIGLNNGVIKRITQNQVVVEETLLNLFGETSQSKVMMELHPQKERSE